MKHLKLIIFVIFLSFLCISNTENILIVQCVETRSYHNLFEAIANIIATEHNVTFISRYYLNIIHPNITLIKTGEQYSNIGAIFNNLYEFAIKDDDTSHFGINAMLSDRKEYVEELMNDPAIKSLAKSKTKFAALIMPSTLSETYFRFAYLFDIPLVQVATSYPMPWQNDAIRNPNYLSTDNSLLLKPYSRNFYGRLVKFIQGLYLHYRYYYQYLPNLNKYSDKYFPPGTPKIEEIAKNTSLLLVNTFESMTTLRPKMSNYVEIGGIHCRPSKDLPLEINNFIKNADKEGLIYMSLGSTIASTFPQHILNSILNVFGKLPQKVIFKLGQKVDSIPKNVLIVKSCPQQDILGHPNTKLFITQGGVFSLQEAVYHEVPVLILPLTLDQPTNAIIANELGYGRYLRLSKFTEEVFFKEITEMLSNQKYSENVKELSILTKDVFKDPKENLKWWINYVIRHKDSQILKYKRHTYSYSSYPIDVDILIFFLLISVFLFSMFIFIIIFILRFVRQLGKIKTE